jgi:hypothetical protein
MLVFVLGLLLCNMPFSENKVFYCNSGGLFICCLVYLVLYTIDYCVLLRIYYCFLIVIFIVTVIVVTILHNSNLSARSAMCDKNNLSENMNGSFNKIVIEVNILNVGVTRNDLSTLGSANHETASSSSVSSATAAKLTTTRAPTSEGRKTSVPRKNLKHVSDEAMEQGDEGVLLLRITVNCLF